MLATCCYVNKQTYICMYLFVNIIPFIYRRTYNGFFGVNGTTPTLSAHLMTKVRPKKCQAMQQRLTKPLLFWAAT